MPDVTVVRATDVEPFTNEATGLIVRPMLGARTGLAAFEQAVLECPPGRSRTIAVGDAEETMFVLDGRGSAHVAGEAEALEPETALYLPPGSELELENPGPGPLRLIAVRVLDPEPAAGGGPPRPAVSRLADQDVGQATAQREFRILADPVTGLRSATHFVGYIPTARAPDHFHHYDEVIYVLDGEGILHAGDDQRPLSAGSCIQLPARHVHCLENTGTAPMRVVAVFRPAGSPAAAYYPDGTPADQGTN